MNRNEVLKLMVSSMLEQTNWERTTETVAPILVEAYTIAADKALSALEEKGLVQKW